MKRGRNVFCILLLGVFLLSCVSAQNLALGSSGVTSTHSGTSGVHIYSLPASRAHDGSYSTFTDVEATTRWANYSLTLSFPNPANLTKLNYSYRLFEVYPDYASYQDYLPDRANTKVEIYSGSSWVEVSSCDVIVDSPYKYGQPYGKFVEECNGNWNSVERVRVTIGGYFGGGEMGDIGGYSGMLRVEEVEAYNEPIPPTCVPNCGGKNCGSDGCGGSCGNCGTNQICSSGVCSDIPSSSCLSDDDIILKLSSDTNAHGALWSDANYNVKVCYSDIFGLEYTGLNPHSCSGTNKVAGLSGVSNAHAQIPSQNSYSTNVCYGNLQCAARDVCLSDEEMVVSLSENTNAHLSSGEDYPIKICCKSSEEYIASWLNMVDELIDEADIGDLVKLGVSGAVTGEIEYEIYRASSSWWWPFDKRVAQTSSWGYTTWRAGIDEEGNLISGDYYFKAKLSGGEATSGNLQVTEPVSNSPPKVKIISPTKDSKFELGEMISFVAEFEDEDDDLRAIWDFDDGKPKITKNNCLTTGNCNVDYTYSENQAAYVVSVVVEEIGREGIAMDSVRILVYGEDLNLFSIIDEPESYKKFDEKSIVTFNAKNSFAANCTLLDTCTFPNPPAGKDPITECYIKRDLHCYDYPKEWIGESYELYFNWTFSEGEPKAGNWSSDYNQVVEFNKLFIQPKAENHWAKLRLGFKLI